MRRRRKEITIETDEALVLRRKDLRRRAWCGGCGPEVEFVTPEAAALASGVTTREVYRLVEAGVAHFFETNDGALLVCARSLTAAWATDFASSL